MNRYVNLDGSGYVKTRKKIDSLRKTIKIKLKRKGVPAASVKPNIKELRKLVFAGDGVRLTWLGHSGWLIQLAGVSILIDPVLGRRINAFIKKQARFDKNIIKSLPIDATLVTHDHYDHLQVRLLKRIGARIIAGMGMEKLLKPKKLDAVELKWWESAAIGNIKITFVPSRHCSQRGLIDHNLRLWGGFIIETPDLCLYHAGDTGYFDIFKEIAHSFKKIDIALLPIGAYGPELTRGRDHLTPEQAVEVYLDLGAKLMIPMHWGTYQISDEPLDEPPQRLIKEWQKKKLDYKKLKIMAVGESFMYKNKL